MTDFLTPPYHVHFLAKKLFVHMGKIIDGSIAYLEKHGGGPETPHTHPHDHLFIVVKGVKPKFYWTGKLSLLKKMTLIWFGVIFLMLSGIIYRKQLS